METINKATKPVKRATRKPRATVNKTVKAVKKTTARRRKTVVKATQINLPKADASIITKTTKELNDFMVDSANTIVDTTIETTLEWQNIADKAIKGGLKLANKQQDLVFDALETLKSSIIQSGDRFKTIFSKN